MTIIRKLLLFTFFFLLILFVGIGLGNAWVVFQTKHRLFDEVEKLPENEVALVLGTARLINNKWRNPYFDYRIDAAYELYKAGKVKHFILSGDNHSEDYDEPTDMKNALLKKGVPESAITLDYAGFRTLDSVVRSHAIFQQQKITIVSQGWHNHRAVFLAQLHDIDAVAYNAKDLYPNSFSKVKFREYLARCKAILDIFIFQKEPKFYGDPINIEV